MKCKDFRVGVLDDEMYQGVYEAEDTTGVVKQIIKKRGLKKKDEKDYLRELISSFIIPTFIGKKLEEVTEASGDKTDFCDWEERCGNEDFDTGFSAGALWLLRLFEVKEEDVNLKGE